MVKKIIALMAMVMLIITLVGSFITKQPLEVEMLDGENDVNQEVVEKKESAQEQQQVVISPYDPIFKEVCREHGNDWRFMSAMAYHESRFTPDVTSRQGAQGMMQIMPNVAAFFNVEKEDLTDVETNIMVANLLVNRISKMLKLSESIPEKDRMGLILASYNGGVGYVLNARKLARQNGENANSWDVVSKYLKEMRCPDYASTHGVRHFKGVSQTIAYVNNVIGHYKQYCQIAML